MSEFLSMGPTCHVKVLGPGSHIYGHGSQMKGPRSQDPLKGPGSRVPPMGSGSTVPDERPHVERPGFQVWVASPTFSVCPLDV